MTRARPRRPGAGLGLPFSFCLAISSAPSRAAEPAALVVVPRASLDGFEPAVARQIAESRARLDAGLSRRDPGTPSAAEDAALFGDHGTLAHAYELVSEAEACYRNAEALAPADFRWPYLRAVLLETADRVPEAIELLERVTRRPEAYYPAILRLAGLHLATGRLDEARSRLDVAARHAPGDAAFLALQGDLAQLSGRHEEAAGAYEKALRARPEATRLHHSLALSLRALGRSREAAAHRARAGRIGVAPNDPVLDAVKRRRVGVAPWVEEGLRALRAGELAGARRAFENALASDPDDLTALTNLAVVDARAGRAADAIERLSRAVALAPENRNVRFNLGALLAAAGRHREAEPHLAAAAALAPEDAEARAALARTREALNAGRTPP